MQQIAFDFIQEEADADRKHYLELYIKYGLNSQLKLGYITGEQYQETIKNIYKGVYVH